ncbi:hypothetical protein G9A89_000566 [Geosiphon pyriformis]|nr:hypothetical protein G9A89_000566 [Geosiphon pyriformis]
MRVWMHLTLAYVTLFLYTLIYASDGDSQSYYVPKSQRARQGWHMNWVYDTHLMAWMNTLYQQITNIVDQWHTSSTIRHRQRLARNLHSATRTTGTCGPATTTNHSTGQRLKTDRNRQSSDGLLLRRHR